MKISQLYIIDFFFGLHSIIQNICPLVFNSQKPGNSNSMTSSGQCRLAPLIPCIQDSSHLYDYIVKLLFKLHSSKLYIRVIQWNCIKTWHLVMLLMSSALETGLPQDILVGHRDRFYKEFKVWVLSEMLKINWCVIDRLEVLLQIDFKFQITRILLAFQHPTVF